MSGTIEVPLRIDPAHPALAGHFPGNPVVPGVVVLERVASAWKAWRGEVPAALDAKFLQPLLPGEAASITLDESERGARFRVTRGDVTLARGSLERGA